MRQIVGQFRQCCYIRCFSNRSRRPMKLSRYLTLLVAVLPVLAACESGLDRITGQIPVDSVGNEAGGGKGGGGDDGGPTQGPPPIADDTTIDPALLLPWSEITGHIVVYHSAPH